jgi:hypothetical protein
MRIGQSVVGAADRDLAIQGRDRQSVTFGGDDSAWNAGGEDERLVGAGEGFAEGLDCSAVSGGGSGEVAAEGDVVLEREMDDPVRQSGGVSQDVKVVERSETDLGAYGVQGLGRRLGAGEPDDLVAGGGQLGDKASTDPTRRSGDKDSHGQPLRAR